MSHPNKTFIDALYEKKAVLFRCQGAELWRPVDDSMGSLAWMALVHGTRGYEFKLKPRMVKIGETEVVAPLIEASFGQIVYVLEADGTTSQLLFDQDNQEHAQLLKARALFSEQHSATAFHAAFINFLSSQC